MSADLYAHDAIAQFRDALRAAGLTPDAIHADGELHRFPSNGKRGDEAGWYVLHLDGGIPAGAFGDWRTGLNESWRADIGRSLTDAERAAQRELIADLRRKREVAEAERQRDAKARAAREWEAAKPADASHPYLVRKGVQPHGLRVDEAGRLLVPVRIAGELHSLQYIDRDGNKRFLPGGRVAGGHCTIGTSKDVICIAEGFATAATIHEATGHTVAVGFNCGNLEAVARTVRERLPKAKLIVCADDDATTDGNPGTTKATEAARAVGAWLAVPDFGTDRPEKATDFNDLAAHRGTDVVKACIANATQPDGEPWLDPQPLPPELHPVAAAAALVNVDGAQLLTRTEAFIRRFCAFPVEHARVAVTLWAAHCHMVEGFHTTPRLALLSPEAGSGKTRVLEVLDLLVPEPMFCLSASPAAIFRTLAERQITLLFDEVDTIFQKRGSDDGNEDLRALLNAGYKRGASIPRCVGPKHEVQSFGVFAATALAGLGDLPDTVMSRSIIIRMRRRAPNEPVDPFRLREHEAPGHAIRSKLAEWAHEVGGAVGVAWPTMPEGIVDRPAEVWEPLIAVADAAGGDWPTRARAACLALVKVAQDRRVTLGIRLLADLRAIFGEADALHTRTILDRLCNGDLHGLEPDAPWGDLHGKAMTERALASMLKKYDIHSIKVWSDGRSLQGYRREHLHDAWTRYLPPHSPKEAEGAEGAEGTGSDLPDLPHLPDAMGSVRCRDDEHLPDSDPSDDGWEPIE